MAAPLTEAAIQQVRHLIAAGQLVPGRAPAPGGRAGRVAGDQPQHGARGGSRPGHRPCARCSPGRRHLRHQPAARAAARRHRRRRRPPARRLHARARAGPPDPRAGRDAVAATRITDDALAELDALLTSDVYGRISRRAGRVRRGVPPPRRRRRGQRHAGLDAQRGVEPHHPRPGLAGRLEAGATERTISEHAAILAALRAHDPQLAEAAALLHVSTTERGSPACSASTKCKPIPEQTLKTPSGNPEDVPQSDDRRIGGGEGARACRTVMSDER